MKLFKKLAAAVLVAALALMMVGCGGRKMCIRDSVKGAANPFMFVVLLVGVQGVAEFLVSGILGGIVARAVAKCLLGFDAFLPATAS